MMWLISLWIYLVEFTWQWGETCFYYHCFNLCLHPPPTHHPSPQTHQSLKAEGGHNLVFPLPCLYVSHWSEFPYAWGSGRHQMVRLIHACACQESSGYNDFLNKLNLCLPEQDRDLSDYNQQVFNRIQHLLLWRPNTLCVILMLPILSLYFPLLCRLLNLIFKRRGREQSCQVAQPGVLDRIAQFFVNELRTWSSRFISGPRDKTFTVMTKGIELPGIQPADCVFADPSWRMLPSNTTLQCGACSVYEESNMVSSEWGTVFGHICNNITVFQAPIWVSASVCLETSSRLSSFCLLWTFLHVLPMKWWKTKSTFNVHMVPS